MQLEAVIANPKAYADQGIELLQLCRRAGVALESPFESFQRLAYSPMPLVAARIAQQHGIFQALADKPSNAATVAANTGLQPRVLEPILDYMTAVGMVDETSSGFYQAAPLARMLLSPLFMDGVIHFHDNCLPAFGALNETLSTPENTSTAFMLGQHTDVDLYTWLESHPVQARAFQGFMEAHFASLPSWLSAVDFGSEFAVGANAATPIMVDVGGGGGQQCVALYQKYPHLTGRIILQDRPAVLAKAITSDRVERMPHDYLTEQPVKGACVYYFRQIFHNNDDETCIRLLRAHAPAMTSESVLLIDDKVLPDQKPPGGPVEYTAALSLAMLAIFNALERRESQWRKLLADTGFEIRAIRRFTDFGDSIIIAAPIR